MTNIKKFVGSIEDLHEIRIALKKAKDLSQYMDELELNILSTSDELKIYSKDDVESLRLSIQRIFGNPIANEFSQVFCFSLSYLACKLWKECIR